MFRSVGFCSVGSGTVYSLVLMFWFWFWSRSEKFVKLCLQSDLPAGPPPPAHPVPAEPSAPLPTRETPEYRAALELELWKEEQEVLFDDQVTGPQSLQLWYQIQQNRARRFRQTPPPVLRSRPGRTDSLKIKSNWTKCTEGPTSCWVWVQTQFQ